MVELPFKENILKVVIFAPHHRSRVALDLIALLLDHGHEVNHIYVKKITQNRIWQELRRDGFHVIYKKVIWKALVPYFKSRSLFHKNSMEELKVSSLKRLNSIDYTEVREFRNIPNLELADVVLFCGGGYVYKSVLDRIPVINCHMGILPLYRGMDVVEWPIWKKDWENIGLTIHYMVTEIDMGNILFKHYIKARDFSTIVDVRYHMLKIMPKLLFESLTYLNNEGKVQLKSDGELYFKMSKALRKETEKIFNAN